jgi:type IV pilus assembly protein PilN
MPDINLLPWREAARDERKRQFTVVVSGTIVLALLVGYSMEFRVETEIKVQNSRNAMLQTGIDSLNKQIAEINTLKERKADMIDRMTVIKGLQTNRPEIVKLFDQFARSIPDGTFITEMSLSGNTVSFEGKAESNNRVSALMRGLDATEKFASPNLTRVDADSALGPQGSNFTMTVAVTAPKLEETE